MIDTPVMPDIRPAISSHLPGKNVHPDRVSEVAEEFEAMMLAEMLKPMFETLPVDPMFGGGKGEEIFRSFMVQEYGKLMAARGGIGIAEHVKTELLRLQEASQ